MENKSPEPQPLVEWTGWPPMAEVETGAPAAIEVADTFTVIRARAILAGKPYDPLTGELGH